MIKKIAFMLLLALCTVSFTVEAYPSRNTRYTRKIDRSSRDALIFTLTRATINNDMETIFELYTPESKQKAIRQYGSRQAAVQKLSNTFTSVRQQVLTNLTKLWGNGNIQGFLNALLDENAERVWYTCPAKLRDTCIKETGSAQAAKKQMAALIPQFKQSLINGFLQKGSQAITMRNGQYYLTDPGDNSTSQAPAARGNGIYSRRELARRFLTALYTMDQNAVWDLLAPASQKQLISSTGSEAAAKKFIKSYLDQSVPANLRPQLRSLVNDKAKMEQVVDNFMSNLNDSNTVKINGCYYMTKL